MRKIWFILILLQCKHSFSQESCKPKYELPVQKQQLSGLNMAYVEKGKGQPVVFIHGLGGNLSHWTKAVKKLSATYKCIAVDLPGYGYSDKKFSTNDKDQLQFYADMLTEFIQKKNLKKIVVAGHSMGAQIAMILAIQQPALISKIVLVSPAGLESFTSNEAQLMIGATPASYFEKQEESAIRSSFKQNFYELPQDAENLIQDRLRLKTCNDFALYTEAVSNGIKGMLNHPVKSDWNKIKQPVLIIYGQNDALIPNKIFHPALTLDSLLKEAVTAMPQARQVLIANAGHMVQFEKPVETSNAIKKFIQ